MDRADQTRDFLNGTKWAEENPVFMTGDASARRYFRLPGAVLMDAPPDDGQSIAPFVKITQMLRSAGLRAPEIYTTDEARGLMLLEDFGDDTFASVVAKDPADELPLYRSLLPILEQLEAMPFADLPVFGPAKMADMISPAFSWYRWAIAGDDLGQDQVGPLMREALLRCDGMSLSLRDFHAENLMKLPEGVGLLDYQDAMVGPRGYDLVSLLLDARRDVSPHVIETVLAEYAQMVGLSEGGAKLRFAILGAQRNLRILGVFTRLALKQGKPRYLDFLPRVWRYVADCVAHPGLKDLEVAINHTIPKPDAAMIEGLKTKCGTFPNRP